MQECTEAFDFLISLVNVPGQKRSSYGRFLSFSMGQKIGNGVERRLVTLLLSNSGG